MGEDPDRFARGGRDYKWLEESTAVALTRPEVADLLDVDVRTVSKAINDGALPSIKLGRRILVPRLPLLEMLSGGAERADAGSPAPKCGETRVDPRPGDGTDTWICTEDAGHEGDHQVVVTRTRLLKTWPNESDGTEFSPSGEDQ